MARFKVSWFDVVGRALDPRLDDREVGKAIAALSAAYRAGRHDLDFETPTGRAAYLWHHLPAHVCDVTRLLLDHPDLLDGESLSLLGLGAGPGSEVVALLDAATQLLERGEPAPSRLRAVRVDRVAAWDESFVPLIEAARRAVAGRGEVALEAPARALTCDLTAPTPPPAVLEAAHGADLLIAANLLTELPPRGTAELPGGSASALGAIFAALPAGAEALLVDRAGAPGAAARLEAAAALAVERRPGTTVQGGRERATRCGCALTRRVKEVYRHVKLPTTRDQDRPVRNCKSLWYRLTFA